MKNHHKHPIGAEHLPEVHNVQDKRKFKGSHSGDPNNKPEMQHFNKKQKPNHKGKRGGDAKSKMTLNVIDVALSITLLKIAVLQSIW
jgi:hypothetical protein